MHYLCLSCLFDADGEAVTNILERRQFLKAEDTDSDEEDDEWT